MFGPDGMAIGQNWCHRDKKALDNIKYLCKQQGKTEWLNKQLEDDERAEDLLESYLRKCPPPPREQAQRCCFRIQYATSALSLHKHADLRSAHKSETAYPWKKHVHVCWRGQL